MTNLVEGSKFAVLALSSLRVDLPDSGVVLSDGTEALTQLPIELNADWQGWLGLQAKEVAEANLALCQFKATGFPATSLTVCDQTNWELAKRLENLLSMLRLLGTIEYESAFVLIGYVMHGQVVCQQFAKLARYESTRGCLPWMVREEHLRAAASLAASKSSFLLSFSDAQKSRVFRGWRALTVGLQQYYASDRIHGFVRALEAVVYPQIGETEKQFVHRCSMFGAPSIKRDPCREALQEAYRMRCDVEHIHEWDRSLAQYPYSERENIALLRTRQLESLACLTYARIFNDSALQSSFSNDQTADSFWRQAEHLLRAQLGCICDITNLQLVKSYDHQGRAAYSEWPAGWAVSLDRQHLNKGNFRAAALGAGT